MNNQELRELPLKKVGTQVLFLETDDTYVRKGEGAFIRLKNGDILHAYTEYYGGNIRDHGEACIAAVRSKDGGNTWQYEGVLIPKPEDAMNIMSVSFLRLQSGEILIFYMKKTLEDDIVCCRPIVRSSFDECESFGPERNIVPRDMQYQILNNDRVIQLKSGRILMGFATSERPVIGPNGAKIRYVVSDDQGKTWQILPVEHEMPFENLRGFEEPGMFQHADGSIWGYYRTNIGCQFETVSRDDGETWTVPKANVFFTGARSPMLVKNVCGKYTVGVFNPISLYTCRNLGGIRGRAPYLLVVSEDDGVSHTEKSFTRMYYLEVDMDNDYCYPAILDCGDYFLIAYYHSNGRERPLNCLKIVKVLRSEIED